MTLAKERHDIQPGWLFTVAYSRRLLAGQGSLPFLLLGVSGGGSGASTREAVYGARAATSSVPLYAFDIGLNLTVGKTFWNVLSPYASARVFGGPVIWKLAGKTQTGTDLHHYKIAAGMVCALPRNVDLFAEVAPLGERSVTIGGGIGF